MDFNMRRGAEGVIGVKNIRIYLSYAKERVGKIGKLSRKR